MHVSHTHTHTHTHTVTHTHRHTLSHTHTHTHTVTHACNMYYTLIYILAKKNSGRGCVITRKVILKVFNVFCPYLRKFTNDTTTTLCPIPVIAYGHTCV